ncbi:MAG: biosynthetic arginine decarboxylase [Planctomycetota bacterium]
MRNQKTELRAWTIQDSEDLYMVKAWGEGYFTIGQDGRLRVEPHGPGGSPAGGVDLYRLVTDLGERGIKPPVLLRFADILADRIRRIHRAFNQAIDEYGYQGGYSGVFPVKVNQERHVIEEVVSLGQPYSLGLETGSKPELLIALAMQGGMDSLIVCNGIKDRDHMELAMLGRKTGTNVVTVLDRIEEVRVCLEAARRLETRPCIGVRARLTSRGAGKWVESTGDRSKFGLSAHELIETVEFLRENDALPSLEMLHFHLGSQITDIRAIKNALRESSRLYTELVRLGAPMGWLNVGGGLAIDYDGSQTNFHSSMNYSLQEYANDVVYSVLEACDQRGIPHPHLVSESGRATVAHHSVLVFDVLDMDRVSAEADGMDPPEAGDHQVLHSLHETWQCVSRKNYLESFHDALQFKEESYHLFNLGYLTLEARARAERMFWATCRRVWSLASELEELPEELEPLTRALSDIYYCNFSVFQSLPDHWAVKQLFPTMPIHRLEERPSRRAVLADLTCDSDGKMDRFIDPTDVADVLPLHLPDRDPYYLGIFLVGAYQEVLGDLHNLFGDTNAVHVKVDQAGRLDVSQVVRGDSVAEVLGYVQYDAEDLVTRVDRAAKGALARERMTEGDVESLLQAYREALKQTTYLRF